jgi:hypothetical protein
MRATTLVLAALLFSPVALIAQDEEDRVDTRSIGLAGPRFGLTFIRGSLADSLKSRYDASSPITQFGWQFETQIFKVDDGLRGLTEMVVLLGGLDQGIVVPTLTWLVGLRGASGMEFGVGPSASPAGIALALAGGVTLKRGGVNFPINMALVRGRGGERLSILTGFNLRRSGRR